MKRALSYLLPACALFMLLFSTAQARSFTEGIHYGVISPPVSTQAEEGNVDVTEVFWYGCPHCFNLEPTIEAYLKQKPDNVTFNPVPAMLGPRWVFHGKLHYVGKMLDSEGKNKVHEKIFAAMHKQRRRIDNDNQLRRFFMSLGYKEQDINAALKSEDLPKDMAYAREISTKSGLDSVPTIIVGGKYLTSPSMLAGANLIEVINFLSKMAAQDLASKPAVTKELAAK